jgi:hypothetical protein
VEENLVGRDKLIGEGTTTSKPADPQLVKDAWLDIVVPVERAGRLDHIPARKAETLRERDIARTQNYSVTRRTYGFSDSDWYERIRWKTPQPISTTKAS